MILVPKSAYESLIKNNSVRQVNNLDVNQGARVTIRNDTNVKECKNNDSSNVAQTNANIDTSSSSNVRSDYDVLAREGAIADDEGRIKKTLPELYIPDVDKYSTNKDGDVFSNYDGNITSSEHDESVNLDKSDSEISSLQNVDMTESEDENKSVLESVMSSVLDDAKAQDADEVTINAEELEQVINSNKMAEHNSNEVVSSLLETVMTDALEQAQSRNAEEVTINANELDKIIQENDITKKEERNDEKNKKKVKKISSKSVVKPVISQILKDTLDNISDVSEKSNNNSIKEIIHPIDNTKEAFQEAHSANFKNYIQQFDPTSKVTVSSYEEPKKIDIFENIPTRKNRFQVPAMNYKSSTSIPRSKSFNVPNITYTPASPTPVHKVQDKSYSFPPMTKNYRFKYNSQPTISNYAKDRLDRKLGVQNQSLATKYPSVNSSNLKSVKKRFERESPITRSNVKTRFEKKHNIKLPPQLSEDDVDMLTNYDTKIKLPSMTDVDFEEDIFDKKKNISNRKQLKEFTKNKIDSVASRIKHEQNARDVQFNKGRRFDDKVKVQVPNDKDIPRTIEIQKEVDLETNKKRKAPSYSLSKDPVNKKSARKTNASDIIESFEKKQNETAREEVRYVKGKRKAEKFRLAKEPVPVKNAKKVNDTLKESKSTRTNKRKAEDFRLSKEPVLRKSSRKKPDVNYNEEYDSGEYELYN